VTLCNSCPLFALGDWGVKFFRGRHRNSRGKWAEAPANFRGYQGEFSRARRTNFHAQYLFRLDGGEFRDPMPIPVEGPRKWPGWTAAKRVWRPFLWWRRVPGSGTDLGRSRDARPVENTMAAVGD